MPWAAFTLPVGREPPSRHVGPEAGYLVRLVANGQSPASLPDFANADPSALVKHLENPSHRVRMAAQRVLINKGSAASLEPLAADKSKPLATRIAALFALKQIQGAAANSFITKLTDDTSITAWALRALTDHEGQLANIAAQPILTALRSPDARIRREAIVALSKIQNAVTRFGDSAVTRRLRPHRGPHGHAGHAQTRRWQSQLQPAR